MNDQPSDHAPRPSTRPISAKALLSPDELDTSEGKLLMEQIFLSRKSSKRRGISRRSSVKSINVVSDSESEEEAEQTKQEEEIADGADASGDGIETGKPSSSDPLEEVSEPEVNVDQTPIHDRFSAGPTTPFPDSGGISRSQLEGMARNIDIFRQKKALREELQRQELEQRARMVVPQSIGSSETITEATPNLMAKTTEKEEEVPEKADKLNYNPSDITDLDVRRTRMRLIIIILSICFVLSLAANIYAGS